jgi:hypothetical protein
MPAALEPLEHEPAGAVTQEARQEPGCRDVEKRRAPQRLQLGGLAGTSAGDQRARWRDLLQHRNLLLAHLPGNEAQQPHTPGTVAEPGGGLPEQGAHLITVRQRQRQERQATLVSHRPRQLRPV